MLPMIVKIIGVLIVLMSMVYIINPAVPRWLIKFFIKGNRMYFAGLFRLVLAVVFLLAARECEYPAVIGVIGVLFLIGALLVFSLGTERLKGFMQFWLGQGDTPMRIISMVGLVIGAAIIYFA